MKTAANTHEPQKCKWCGKEFIPTSYRNICCSRKCTEMHRATEAKNKRAARKKKTNEEKIRDIALEAKAHGMTYGKYVAYLEMQKNKEKKCKVSK